MAGLSRYCLAAVLPIEDEGGCEPSLPGRAAPGRMLAKSAGLLPFSRLRTVREGYQMICKKNWILSKSYLLAVQKMD